MKRTTLLSACGLVLALAATPALTQQVQTLPGSVQPGLVQPDPGAQPQIEAMAACGERELIVSKLTQDFRETPAAVGMVNQDAVLEIFVSDAGTWTILATGTDGKSCVLSAGEGWQSTGEPAGEGV